MAQPNYLSADGYIGETFVTLNFDISLDAAHPPQDWDFMIQVNGSPVLIDHIVVNSTAKTVKLYLDSTILTPMDTVDISYNDPSAGNDVAAIQALDGTDCASFVHSVFVAITRPAPATPATPVLALASDSGTSGDGITNITTPTLTGTVNAGATVRLYENNGATLLGSTTADGSGNWSITSSALSVGAHTLKVVQLDSNNYSSALSNGLTLTIDTSAAAPTSLAVAAGSDSGTLGDGISNVVTPVITGQSEAGASVTLYDTNGSTVLGTATANGSGAWSITSSTLAAGVHTLTAKQVDVAGNQSVASSAFSYTADTTGPTGMALSTNSVMLANASNGATIATLSSTDLTSVTYSFVVGNGAIDADNGKFSILGTSLKAAQTLTAGAYHIYLGATDAAGNASFQIFTVNVLDAPSVTSIVRTGGAAAATPASSTSVSYTVTFDQSVTGVDASDFTLTGSGSASGSVSAVSGSGSTYTVTVNTLAGDGTLRLDLNSSGTGIQNGSSVAISSGYSAGQTYLFDHTAPAAPSTPAMSAGTDTGNSASDAITSNLTPVFTGTGESGATVRLYDTDGTTPLGSATADGAGHWSITSSTLTAGSHSLTVKQTDAAGNQSVASGALTAVIDNTAPAAATLSLTAGSDSGTVGDLITNQATPTISGTAEANARVRLYDTDGVTLLGTTYANGSGSWSITSSTLSEGSHTLTVKQTDTAGNVSVASAGLVLTIDTQAPAAPAITGLSVSSDTGAQGDAATYISTPVMLGTASAGSNVLLYDSNGTTVLGNATADGSGHWSITSAALTVGVHTLTAKAQDTAGNMSSSSAALSLTIETAPEPEPAPVIVDGVVLDQSTVTLPDGGLGAQTIIPVVTSARQETNGSTGVADIPLVTENGQTTLLAQLPIGFGLTASGGSAQAAGNALNTLLSSIMAVTPTHSSADQSHLAGNGISFLNQLGSSLPLLVQTVVPVTQGTVAGSLTLAGSNTGEQHTALVIDASNISLTSQLVLKNVDFAAVIGSASVVGSTSGQILSGDGASQRFSVYAGGHSNVFAGGGNDTLSMLASPLQGGASEKLSGAAATAATLLHAGAGQDIASFSGSSKNYTIDQHEGYVIVTPKGASGAQTGEQVLVINAEILKFADTSMAVQSNSAIDTIDGLYVDVLGRQGDYRGIEFWTERVKAGASLGAVALDIIASAESQARHAGSFNGDSQHDVALLYQCIFNRAADSTGLNFWVDKLAHGLKLEDVAQAFVTSAEIVGHKVAVQNWDFVLG